MKKIRVLWICNIVLPEFADRFDIKMNRMGGWMSGMFNLIDGDYKLALCFPIYDEHRRKSFIVHDNYIYSFNGQMDREDINEMHVKEFKDIFRSFDPGVIHIWGTEYNHAYYAVKAAISMGWANRILVDIQGLMTYYAVHFCDGLPKLVYEELYKQIGEEKQRFACQGLLEQRVLTSVTYVTGRTEWDLACAMAMNRDLVYYHNDRVLREVFYSNTEEWSWNSCKKHSLFLSNGSYPVKGMHLFIDVIVLLCKEYDDLEVVVAGVNPTMPNDKGEVSDYGKYLTKLITERGVRDRVNWKGVLNEDEMIHELKKANVFVASSTIENSCNSACEAMMIGTPVVSAYSGGLPSLIHHGEDGFFYQTNAPYMGAYYIKALFDNKSLAEEISNRGKVRAKKRHDKKNIKTKMAEIYNSIAPL